MTTLINNPGNGDRSDSSVGAVVGVITLLVFVGLFFIYILPAIQAGGATPKGGSIDVNLKLPPGTDGSAPKQDPATP